MINSSSDNVKKLNSINRRMFITGSLKFFIMIGIVSRLFFLQVKENKKYLTLSDKNRIRELQEKSANNFKRFRWDKSTNKLISIIEKTT